VTPWNIALIINLHNCNHTGAIKQRSRFTHRYVPM